MAALSVTAFTSEDFPGTIVTGVAKRLKRFYCACSAAATTDTLTISTYISESAKVEHAMVTTATGISYSAAYGSGSVVPGTAGTTNALGISGIISCT